MLPFISRSRRKWRVDLNSATHWTKNELQPLIAPLSRIRLAVWTGWTELQIRRKVLVLKEKQPTTNQCDGLFFFQVGATGFEPPTESRDTIPNSTEFEFRGHHT